MMPSPSDSSRSLTSRPSTRGLTHLRLHRPWLQALLTLGLAQVLLGILVVTFSMVASSITTTESVKRSCPSWAGFSVSWAHSCWVGEAPWAPPLNTSCQSKSWPLLISFFSLLSVLCVMLSMAGSVLSCKNAQLARDFQDCDLDGKVCVCCPSVRLLRPCPESGQELKIAPNSTCDEARGALKNLLFSVCGLTISAAIICTLSAIVCCIQIFSLDLVHTQLAPERSVSGPLGPLGCTSSPPDPLLHTMLDLEEFVPPVPPPPYYPPDSGSLTPPGHRPPHPAPRPPLLLPRSHSDPGITTSSNTAEFRDLYTKVLEEEAASVSSADTGLCSEACLFRLAHCPSPKLLRARSAEKRRPVPTFQKVPLPSGPAPAHSLGDLKGSWPGRGLVTRFLQMSRKAPDPSGNGAHAHKQVPRSPWGRPGRESLHLRSCGDLSSGSSLRRLLSGRRLERATRPHSLSLNGGSRETGL
ncbi:hypothetical protein Celaphus_00001929 [Cervus elaphus hippelaphus]|uniref:FAM189B n=1 Tax=Cervus elaphus hippelaphus TaxID=46360 RepID=A0A212CGU8_CEREH|nr:hypothetical protein Celaphus_00001929 [Cervus elaphus hippelaphus]